MLKAMLSALTGNWRVHTRDNQDTAQDVLLLLYLLSKSDTAGKERLEAQIRLMKLAFLSEYELSVRKKYKGFNFFFNIFKHGPSSKELLNLLDLLVEKKLVSYDKENPKFSLTDAGKETLESFVGTVENNGEFFKTIDETLEKYNKLDTQTLLKEVYAMDVQPMYSINSFNIGEAVKNTPRKRLLMRLQKEDATKELNVPDEWVNTIDVVLNTRLYA